MRTNSCQKKSPRGLKLLCVIITLIFGLPCVPSASATGYLSFPSSIKTRRSVSRAGTAARLPLLLSRAKKELEYIVNTTYLRTVRYGLYFYKSRPKFIIPCAPGIADSLSFFLSGSRRDKEAIDRLQGQLTTDANPKPHTYKSGVANDITSRTYCRFHLQIPVSVQLTVSGSSYMYRVYYDSTVP